jgi:hypothetical protein
VGSNAGSNILHSVKQKNSNPIVAGIEEEPIKAVSIYYAKSYKISFRKLFIALSYYFRCV